MSNINTVREALEFALNNKASCSDSAKALKLLAEEVQSLHLDRTNRILLLMAYEKDCG